MIDTMEPPFTRLDPLNDFLFEKMLGEKGDEPQLLSFLTPILARTGRDLQEIEIVENKILTPEAIGGKKGILDIRAKVADGPRCNIEVQRKNQHNMKRRSLFYWAREYIDSLEAGKNYKELPDVIAINILDFDYIPIADFHTTFHLWEDRNKEHKLTNAMEFHFIEIPKFRRLAEKDIHANPLHRWLSYMDITTPLPVIKEVIEMDAAIAKTQEIMELVNKDKQMLHAYHMYEMALSDETSRLEDAIEDKALEIAKNFLSLGLSPEQISKGTGLSLKDILSLQ